MSEYGGHVSEQDIRVGQEKTANKAIEYPYMPDAGEIVYVDLDNEFMQLAKEFARIESLDKVMPNTSVIVKSGEVLGIGANGSNYHETNGCERVRRNIPTGQGYDLCEGCNPKNHGEAKAISNALERLSSEDLQDAEIYLWGHWWCCESCWSTMLDKGISTVYLLESSEVLFNREESGNIIGR